MNKRRRYKAKARRKAKPDRRYTLVTEEWVIGELIKVVVKTPVTVDFSEQFSVPMTWSERI